MKRSFQVIALFSRVLKFLKNPARMAIQWLGIKNLQGHYCLDTVLLVLSSRGFQCSQQPPSGDSNGIDSCIALALTPTTSQPATMVAKFNVSAVGCVPLPAVRASVDFKQLTRPRRRQLATSIVMTTSLQDFYSSGSTKNANRNPTKIKYFRSTPSHCD